MRSTPRHNPITVSGVTGTTPPHGQHNPYSQQDPSGGWYAQPTPPAPVPKKSMSTGVILAIVFGSIAALCAIVGIGAALTAMGGDSTPGTSVTGAPAATGTNGTTTAAAKTAQLGQTLIFKGAFGGSEIHYTVSADKTYTQAPGYPAKPEKGVYYVINAGVEAKKGSAFASPFDFALIGADGTVYEPTAPLGFDNALTGTQINEGQKTAGRVVFDVPQAALAKAKIELRADFFSSGDAGYWQLP